jgi:peptidoglycan/LPS O-acetylase OafA/YrhL
MQKTKLKQRINNAVTAFFVEDTEKFGEHSLDFANDAALLKQETTPLFNEKGDVLVKILKQTFIFLPGALYLFFGAIFGFIFEPFWENPLHIFLVFLIGALMTIFGIGNIKNPKHLAIPLSIVAVGITAFSLFSMFGKLKYIFEYGIYFFPIALIVAFLTKSLVDKAGKEKKSLKTPLFETVEKPSHN